MEMKQAREGYRLSPQQRREWTRRQSQYGGVSACVARLEGEIEVGRLRKAVEEVVRRQEILRSGYEQLEGLKTAVQVIGERVEVKWEERDVRGKSKQEQEEEVRRAYEEESSDGQEWEGVWPRVRVVLFKKGEGQADMVLRVPVISSDSRSLINFIKHFSYFYAGTSSSDQSQDEILQYADFSRWQNEMQEGEEADAAKQFWNSFDLGQLWRLKLPFERDLSSRSARRSVEFCLAGEDRQMLAHAARANDTTEDVLLLAAWQATLWRLSPLLHQVCISTLSHGRHHDLLDDAFGLFAREIPAFSLLEADMSLADLTHQIQQWLEQATEWGDFFDIDRAREDLGEGLSGRPVGYEYEQVGQSYDAGPLSVRVQSVRSEVSRSKLQMRCEAGEESMRVELVYEEAVYSRAEVERVSGYVKQMLRGLCRGESVGEVEIVGEQERRALVYGLNETEQEGVRYASLQEMIERQAEQGGARVAVVSGDEEMSYEEMNGRANQVGRYLRKRGVGPEEKVGLCVERGVEMVVGMLGIMKAGGAYVPLDPAHPRERLSQQLSDIKSTILLTQKRLLERLPDTGVEIVCLDEPCFDDEPTSNPTNINSPQNIAYVIYTSGSTGTSKGVAVTHQNLINYVSFMRGKLGLNEAESPRVLSFATASTISADLGNTSIFTSLASGGCLHVLSYDVSTDSNLFADYSSEHPIDVLKMVPSHLNALLSSERGKEILPREYLILGGEAFSFKLLNRVMELSSDLKIINHYGPTETTIGSLTYSLSDGGDALRFASTVCIGRPIANTQVYILDEHLNSMPMGVPGELYIGGEGVARGYLNHPQQTAEKFLPNPFTLTDGARLYRTGDLARYLPDGNVEFLGRKDYQVKIRGFRVELGEIEAALLGHPMVRECVVALRSDESEHKRLVAYVVPDRASGMTSVELAAYLKEKLPEYMVPSAFVTLDSMPLNANGKIDRSALPDPGAVIQEGGRNYAPPTNWAEQLLAKIWGDVLGIQNVGLHDNFFELGGDSILSIQVAARANEAGLHLTPRQMFQYQTIAELADVADETTSVHAAQGIVTGAAPLTPIQQWFFEQKLDNPHHWNQSLLLEVKQEMLPHLLEASVRQLLVHHDALRHRFTESESGWHQTSTLPDDAVPFTWIDLSGVGESQHKQVIEEAAAAMQESLNISEGPILRVALFDLGKEKPARLLMVIHHLVVDGVSWRILLDDLMMAYRQVEAGEALALLPKTTSFKHWAEQLVEAAQSAELQQEVSYWASESRARVLPLPVDYHEGINTAASTQSVTVALDAEETQALLKEVPQVYRTQINEVLLTALALAYSRWAGSPLLLVDLEGHGREEVVDNVDLLRTVGWFTIHIPLLLELADAADLGGAMKSVKEQVREIPNRGIGYGMLRYLSNATEVRDKLKAFADPQISFNYLGQFDHAITSSSIVMASESSGPTRSPQAKRHHLLEIVGNVAGGRLQMSYVYSENIHRRETVESLAEEFIEAMRSLIKHCRSSSAGGYTPSDFPLVKLNQESLDRLVATYHQIEDIYPLSPLQQGLLFHALYKPEEQFYLEQKVCMLAGNLNAQAFRKSWEQTLNAHAALHTAFAWDGLEQPLQVICRGVALPWDEQDWRGISEREQEERWQAYLQADRARGLDVSVAPLMRLALIRVADDRYRFLWSHHHLLLDGWSLPRVFNDVFAFYDGYSRGRDVQLQQPRPFRDYIAWLAEQDNSKAESFWRDVLKGFTEPTPLVKDEASRKLSERAEIYESRETQLSEETTSTLKALARQQQVTMNTLIQGVWAMVLGQHSGRDEIIFGATTSGRPTEIPGIEYMVGLFINTLPVRVRVRSDAQLFPWLRELQSQQVDMRQYEYTPLAQIQQWSEVPHGMPLFESILVFDNYPVNRAALPEDASDESSKDFIALLNYQALEKTNYPMLVQAGVDASLLIRVQYDCQLFQAETISKLLGQLNAALNKVAETQEVGVSVLKETISEVEQRHKAIAQSKRKESKLKKFMEVEPKSISLTPEGLVKTGYLSESQHLPLVLSPSTPDADLLSWASLNRSLIDSHLLKHGALLFRGFDIHSISSFELFAQAVCLSLYDRYGDLPREGQGGKVYGSTPYPSDEAILFHNESSHLHSWPMKILFHCVKAAAVGGNTPLVDCRLVYRGLSEELRQQFKQKGLMYVRNFGQGLDVSWQDFYRTESREEVERQCRESGTQWEWKGDGGLRTRKVQKAVRVHPRTGEEVFFNQVQLHHVSCLREGVRGAMESVFGEEEMPRSVYWGDGARIEEWVMKEVGRAYEGAAVRFGWEEGDVILVDNMLVAHGRDPFEGERKIVVSMGEMRGENDG